MKNKSDILSLSDLFASSVKHTLRKGQILDPFIDDRIYMIHSGFVKRYLITKEGDYAIQAIYGSNQIFPLTVVVRQLFSQDISNDGKVYYYQTLNDVVISSINVHTLEEALNNDPYYYKALLLEAAKRLKSNIQQLDNKPLKSPRWRIAHQLVFYANEFGIPVKNGVSISLPLTQSDIASMLSISRETVSRAMTRLHEQNLVKSTNGILTINSLEDLKNIYT